jgi:site-specific DNA-cytosine methylase
MRHAQGLGTSGKTFAALMSLIDVILPRSVILENVDDLENPESGNTEWLYQCFAKKGYVVTQQTMLSNEYGSPQRRKRTARTCSLQVKSQRRVRN